MPKLSGRKTHKSPEVIVKVENDPTTVGEVYYDKAIYIDPGDRYIGVAVFTRDQVADTWDCTDAWTVDTHAEGESAEQFIDFLWAGAMRGEWDIIGYEVWRLYEDKAQEQKGSEFLATQLIGQIKFVARKCMYMNRWPRQPLELVRFLPDHKKPTAGIMKTRGIDFESRRRGTYGNHAWDAELQGFFDIVKNRNWKYERRAQ